MSLIKIYMQGFNDCFYGISRESTYETTLERRAYNFGWNDYVVGDDIPSWDNQTEEQILERINKPWTDQHLPR